ncbi:MAG: hypothetical protein AAB569_04265 [Patescibacteria group bacterium]
MATIVNNPNPVSNEGGSSFLVGVILLIGFVMIILYFGIPAIKNMGPIQLNIPAPKVVIPDKINVNVQQAK